MNGFNMLATLVLYSNLNHSKLTALCSTSLKLRSTNTLCVCIMLWRDIFKEEPSINSLISAFILRLKKVMNSGSMCCFQWN